MTTQGLILWLILLLTAVFGALVWLAALGYLLAYIALAVLATVALIGLGLSFGLIHTKIAAERQQQMFMDNAQENLTIMSALQSVQNKQNQALMQQLNQVSRLPQPQTNNGFQIAEGIFDELDD